MRYAHSPQSVISNGYSFCLFLVVYIFLFLRYEMYLLTKCGFRVTRTINFPAPSSRTATKSPYVVKYATICTNIFQELTKLSSKYPHIEIYAAIMLLLSATDTTMPAALFYSVLRFGSNSCVFSTWETNQTYNNVSIPCLNYPFPLDIACIWFRIEYNRMEWNGIEYNRIE